MKFDVSWPKELVDGEFLNCPVVSPMSFLSVPPGPIGLEVEPVIVILVVASDAPPSSGSGLHPWMFKVPANRLPDSAWETR